MIHVLLLKNKRILDMLPVICLKMEIPTFATIDVSFISLKYIFDAS